VKADGVLVGDIITSDPYLVVSVTDPQDIIKLTTRTRPVFNTLNPEWNETWCLVNVPLGAKVTLDLYDYDHLKEDDFLGSCAFTFEGEGGEAPLKVRYRDRHCGTLFLKIECKESDGPTGADIPTMKWVGPIRYATHFSKVAGVITNCRNDDEHLQYATYEVHLPFVHSVFGGVKQPWNKTYWRACKTFGDSTKCKIKRETIRTEHKALYQHDKTSRYGTIRSGDDFLRLFHYGVRQGVPRIYTYVLVDEIMRFSETGAAFFKDHISKHSMHTSCAKEIYYAGEFHVENLGEGKWRLVLDNNSGTYDPNTSLLPNLEQLFSSHFQDIDICARDRKDLELKEWRKNYISV